MKQAIVSIDGASKGNPGPAGIGVVIRDSSGIVLKEISEYIGTATNNIAEYSALVKALTETSELGFTHVTMQSDSELMVKQINGQYKVKNEGIIQLYQSANSLIRKFNSFSINHVVREHNKLADKLASSAASSKGQPQLDIYDDSDKDKHNPVKQTEDNSHRIGVRSSSKSQMIDITKDVQEIINSSKIKNGICMIFVPHTTAGITINENADPDVVSDILMALDKIVPVKAEYRHSEGNSDAHLKASMMGFSVNVIIENGKLLLGTWQGIYFCEFDGPRHRHVFVKIY